MSKTAERIRPLVGRFMRDDMYLAQRKRLGSLSSRPSFDPRWNFYVCDLSSRSSPATLQITLSLPYGRVLRIYLRLLLLENVTEQNILIVLCVYKNKNLKFNFNLRRFPMPTTSARSRQACSSRRWCRHHRRRQKRHPVASLSSRWRLRTGDTRFPADSPTRGLSFSCLKKKATRAYFRAQQLSDLFL